LCSDRFNCLHLFCVGFVTRVLFHNFSCKLRYPLRQPLRVPRSLAILSK
jgi:hypothetical protein